jgi:putative methionine-R-sulfoxide reductase with GAF domain
MNRLTADFLQRIRSEARRQVPQSERAREITSLVREHTQRRWIGVYRVDEEEVAILGWSGPSAPAHPRFSTRVGLTGEAVRGRRVVVSNDVASDSRYLVAFDTTGSEMIVPIVLNQDVVGTLDVEDPMTDAFNDADRELFMKIAAELEHLFR